MTLPASGQISFNDIRVELGVPSQAPFSLDSASNGTYAAINTNSPSYPSGSNPDSVSEWYSYNHNACFDVGDFFYTDTLSDPSDCDPFNVYNQGLATLFSTCIAPLTNSCTVYTENTCTTTAYSSGIIYFTDGSAYYRVNVNSDVDNIGFCV